MLFSMVKFSSYIFVLCGNIDNYIFSDVSEVTGDDRGARPGARRPAGQ